MATVGILFVLLALVSGMIDIHGGGDQMQSLVFAVISAGYMVAGTIKDGR